MSYNRLDQKASCDSFVVSEAYGVTFCYTDNRKYYNARTPINRGNQPVLMVSLGNLSWPSNGLISADVPEARSLSTDINLHGSVIRGEEAGFVRMIDGRERYLHNYADGGYALPVTIDNDGTVNRYTLNPDGSITLFRKEFIDGSLHYATRVPFATTPDSAPGNAQFLSRPKVATRTELIDGDQIMYDDRGYPIRHKLKNGDTLVSSIPLDPFTTTDPRDRYGYYTFSPAYFTGHYIDDQVISQASPAQVAALYYELLNWQMVSGCPEIVPNPIISPGCLPIEAYVREYDTRIRIYKLRQDLHVIKDVEGVDHVGLIPPDQFPIYGGMKCKTGLLQQIGEGILFTALSFIPVLGTAISISHYAVQINDIIKAKQKSAELVGLFGNAKAGLDYFTTQTSPGPVGGSVPSAITPAGGQSVVPIKASVTIPTVAQAASSPSALWPILIAIGVALMN